MSNEDKNLDLGRSPADSTVHRLLRKLGSLIPETADDVKHAEAEVEHDPVELPAALMNPDHVFEGSMSLSLPRSSSSRVVADAEVIEGFSAAARDGRGLSPELKTQLEQDWEQARRKREAEDGDSRSLDR